MLNLPHLRTATNKRLAELAQVRAQISEEKAQAETTQQHLADLEEARGFIQTVAQKVQHYVHSRIAAVVSRCLSAIFDDPYEFEIIFEQKRGRTEARLVFKRNGVERDPTFETGIGAVEVAAFALRLACLMLTVPRVRRLLVVDEPFKNLNGATNQARMEDMLTTLSHDLDLQIIMVTDDDWLKIGKTIEIGAI